MHRKEHLVAGGHLVDILDNKVYSSKMKGINVKLLHVSSHSVGLGIMCSDIDNAYVNTYTTEKVYVIAGREYGQEMKGKMVAIKKALYSLAT
eukprot:14224710-Ditylum_brightwellii.AAC.1